MPRRDPTPERHGWSHEAHARRRPSWQVRLSILASGVGALLAVAFIVVGVPWLLIRFVGNPLPSAMPDLDTITWSLRNGQIPNRFWIGALALVVWVVWAQLTVALLMETAAVIRSVEAPMLPTFGFAGSIATQLVGAVVLLSVVATAVPAEVSALSAAPLSSGPSPTPAAQTTIVEQPVAEATAPMPLLRVDIERRATLRSLASEYLGDAERWGEIRDHNVGAVMGDGTVLPAGFTRISAGWQLEIPGVADVLGTWTVQEGDHFWRIATETLEAAYGRAPSNEETTHYWQEIVTLNDPQVRSGDPDLIHPGERFDVTLPPIPAAGLAADAPLVASDFTLSGLLPENVFEPAEALPSEPAPTGSDAGLRWSVPGSVADAANSLTSDGERAEPADELSAEAVGAATRASGVPSVNEDRRAPQPTTTSGRVVAPLAPTSTSSDGSSGRKMPDTRAAAGTGAASTAAPAKPLATTQPPGIGTPRLVAGAAGLGFLAYGLARALRRRRELQWSRRVEGRVPAPASGEAVLLMSDIETTSAGSRATELDHFLRTLFADLAPTAAAQITHIEVDDDEIVLHTSGPVGGLGPCRPDATETRWVISRTDALAIGHPGVVESDACPGLVGVGVDPHTGADVLLNLGHALALEPLGPASARQAFLRTVATELATSPFADELQVVCCGFGNEIEDLRRVHGVASVREAIEHVRSDPFRSFDALAGDGAQAARTVVLVADEAPPEQLDELVQLTLGGVVVVAPGIASRWTVALSPGAVTIAPIDRTLRRHDLTADQFSAVTELIATSALSEYVPPLPSPIEVADEVLPPDDRESVASFEPAESLIEPVEAPERTESDSPDVSAVGPVPSMIGDEPTGGDNEDDDEPVSVGVALDCDIEVRVLGRVEVIGADRDFESARALDVITYLAFHRDGADADQLRTWLWPVDEPPTDKAFANVLSRARKGLGVDDEGSPYLSRAGRDGVYRLSKAVATDFDRFMAHIEHARTLDGEAALAQQVEALELVRGVPFTGGGATGFIWTDLGTRAHLDFTIDEAAHACADDALASGDSATARWAAMKGLLIIPGCEQCYRRRLLAAAADGNRNELVGAMGELQRHLAADSGEPEAYDIVSPDLVDLYEDLVTSLGRATSGPAIDLANQTTDSVTPTP